MSVSFASLYGRLVDLHLHSDGSISVPAARRLAEIAGTPIALSAGAAQAEQVRQIRIRSKAMHLRISRTSLRG